MLFVVGLWQSHNLNSAQHAFLVKYGEMNMQSELRRIKRPPTNGSSKSLAKYKPEGNRLNRFLESVSLKDVSLEERRREARKPLYLLRYE